MKKSWGTAENERKPYIAS